MSQVVKRNMTWSAISETPQSPKFEQKTIQINTVTNSVEFAEAQKKTKSVGDSILTE